MSGFSERAMTKKLVVLCVKKTYCTLEELATRLTEAFQKLSPEDQREWSKQVPKSNKTREGEWIQ